MKRTFKNISAVCALGLVVGMTSCQSDPNSPGYEYFPDMYRSPAIEAYIDYGMEPYRFDTIDNDALRMQEDQLAAMMPVAGTIPFCSDASKAMFNFPYPYPITDAGYQQAGMELRNPVEWSEDVVAEGGAIFDRMCAHCHGEAGDGKGTVITNSVAQYAPPKDFTSDYMMGLNEGHMFHSISYGKGLAMGSHASQLSKEQRWMVVHYIRSMFQEKDPAHFNSYDADGNVIVDAGTDTPEGDL